MSRNGVLMLALVVGPAAYAADPPAQPAANAQTTAPADTPAAAPAPAATPATAPAPVAAPAAPATGGNNPIASSAGQNAIKLRDLERHVSELKEQIFRSKAKLNLLKETVLHGVIAGARAVITHTNEMGSLYTPIRYVYAIDGNEIWAKTDDNGLKDKEFEVFNGAIAPGNHTLSVTFVYQGNGYGLFSYLKGYKFTAKSSHPFTAAEGKQLNLRVIGFEKGNPVTTDPKDRPSVDFKETVLADKDVAAVKTAAKK